MKFLSCSPAIKGVRWFSNMTWPQIQGFIIKLQAWRWLENIEHLAFTHLFRVPSPQKKKIKKVVCHNDTSIPFPESPTSKYPLRVCCRWIGQKSHHSFGREKVTSPMNESERSEFFFGDSREVSKNENPHSDWKIWVECLIEWSNK